MLRWMPAFIALELLGLGLPARAQLHLNDRDYLEPQGLSVLVYQTILCAGSITFSAGIRSRMCRSSRLQGPRRV